jgi:hypothetical protein
MTNHDEVIQEFNNNKFETNTISKHLQNKKNLSTTNGKDNS